MAIKVIDFQIKEKRNTLNIFHILPGNYFVCRCLVAKSCPILLQYRIILYYLYVPKKNEEQ